jgi:hypothetical protein
MTGFPVARAARYLCWRNFDSRSIVTYTHWSIAMATTAPSARCKYSDNQYRLERI